MSQPNAPYPAFFPMSAAYDDALLLKAISDSNQYMNQANASLSKDIAASAYVVRESTDRNAGMIKKDIYDSNQYMNQAYAGLSKDVTAASYGLRESLDRSSDMTQKNIYDSTRSLGHEIYGISKDLSASTLGLRDAVERGQLNNANITERTAAQSALAIERNGAMGLQTTERVGANAALSSERIGGTTLATIERVAGEGRLTTAVTDAASREAQAGYVRDMSVAIERNGANGVQVSQTGYANLLASVERNSGEVRLTTTVTDAAAREAAAGFARELAISIERNGANSVQASQTSYAGLLSSLERNSGETRASALQVAAQTGSLITDVRHSVLNDVNRASSENIINANRGFNEIVGHQVNSSNTITKAITDSAWESRTAVTSSMMEQLKMGSSIKTDAAAQYSSIVLENAKSAALLSSQGSNQYASMLLEQQKMKEYLGSKGDNQFAMTQLELMKVKEGLACQAAQNFSIGQLEQQKLGSLISAQLAEAKYEALKSQQYVADKVDECCCEVKEKIDTVDRDRLRDSLVVEKGDNNILKIIELTQLARGGFDRGGYDDHHHRHRR